MEATTPNTIGPVTRAKLFAVSRRPSACPDEIELGQGKRPVDRHLPGFPKAEETGSGNGGSFPDLRSKMGASENRKGNRGSGSSNRGFGHDGEPWSNWKFRFNSTDPRRLGELQGWPRNSTAPARNENLKSGPKPRILGEDLI